MRGGDGRPGEKWGWGVGWEMGMEMGARGWELGMRV